MHSIGSVLFLVAAVQAVLRNVFCLESAELKQRVKDDIRHPGGLSGVAAFQIPGSAS